VKKPVRSLALLSVAGLAVGLAATSAAAAPKAGAPEILAKDLAGPLTTAVADDGSVYVTANFGGKLYKYAPDGTRSVVYKNKGAEVGAVSVSGDRLVFSTTVDGGAKKVYESVAGGAPHVIANTMKYEKAKNPDKKTVYGFDGITKNCAAQLPKQVGPAQYTGAIDSHPYSTAIVGDTVYVGDAGGNAILSISSTGKIKTVAVLPPAQVKVTQGAIDGLGLPQCVKGLKYGFEGVPTDVEMGPDGWLYVSSLPGGPEDASLGARGLVYKVNPGSGKVKLVASGFLGAVNVAVADNGDVYVSQLFGGEISRIPAGTSKVKPFAKVNMPAGLEWTADGLYATIDALKGTKSPKGKLAFIPFS
jgi:hypothetical protein